MPTDDVENGGNSSSKDTAKEHTRSPRACTEKEYAEPRFACKSYACAIQDCLARYSYDQRMCSQEIEALVACCRSLQQPQGSLHCQGFMHLIVPKEMGKPHPQQWQ